MRITVSQLLFLTSLLIIIGCYTDDSTAPNPDRLPFENFSEFFAENNEDFENYLFDAEEAVSFGINSTLDIAVPNAAIEMEDSVRMQVRTAFEKSDLVLLNRPTVSGDLLLESVGAFNVQMNTNAGPVLLDGPIEVSLVPENPVATSELRYYEWENDWTVDENVAVAENGNSTLSFASSTLGWQMLATEFEVAERVEMTFNPFGYGTIPLDMKAFAVLDEHQVVIDLNTDVTAVSASASLPKDTPLTIVVLLMDNFKLSVGMLSTVLTTSGALEVEMDIVELDEMINIIQGLDE